VGSVIVRRGCFCLCGLSRRLLCG